MIKKHLEEEAKVEVCGGTQRGDKGIKKPTEEKVTKGGSSTKIVNEFTESFFLGCTMRLEKKYRIRGC